MMPALVSTTISRSEFTPMSWSPQQDAALREIGQWARDDNAKQVFRLFGFAGSGKTTLAREIAENVDEDEVLFGAFTGKAALVLRSKGCRGASTIHSMIYAVDVSDGGVATFMLDPGSKVADAKLVIIDECSMVDEQLGRDLLSFGTKILVLGDPAQLPPVRGAGFFTNAEPDIMLTEVHRQARDNPIIRMSMDVREGNRLQLGHYGNSAVIKRADISADRVMAADQLLVGVNRTRRAYNARIRKLKDITAPFPIAGDRLVCLKNMRPKGLLNGGIWNVERVIDQDEDPEAIRMEVSPDDAGGAAQNADVIVHHAFFHGEEDKLDWVVRRDYDEFDFGYALTVHKSQGSQWRDVVLFDESAAFRENRTRHLYTAITRAAERITVVI